MSILKFRTCGTFWTIHLKIFNLLAQLGELGKQSFLFRGELHLIRNWLHDKSLHSLLDKALQNWQKKFHQIFSYLLLSITDYICTYIHHDQRHQHHHQSSHPLPTSSAVSSVPTRRSCITWGVDRWMLVWKILVLNLPQKLLICYNSQNSLLVFKLLFPNLGQKTKENISPAPVVLAP